MVINEKNRQKAVIAAKQSVRQQAKLVAIQREKRQIMADGLIHREDGTLIDPATHLEVNGANNYVSYA